jgi:hypothetical protein
MNFKDLKNYFNKTLTFYSPANAGYWNSITKCCISKKPTTVNRYYLDFISKVDYPDEFSSDCIPLYSLRGKRAIEHPIVIAQYALGLFESLNDQQYDDEDLKAKFIKIADWFRLNKINIKHGVGWYIQNKYPEYGLNYPWISCMAQGEAISVLTRAALLSNNNDYLTIAIDALPPFEFEVKEGGLINYFNSIPVYEEFPSPIKTMGVLNGFIFSLFGLYDLILATDNIKAKALFSKGVSSLKKLLPYYDFGYWTRYYLYDYPKKYTSSFTYHMLVAEQLKVMFFLTGDNLFLDYNTRWIGYTSSLVKKSRALLNKLVYANKLTP